MKLQKISNFKTQPYDDCIDAKYDDHHAELFNPHTGEVYQEEVMPDRAGLNRFSTNDGYYDNIARSDVGYGDWVEY